MSEIKKGDKYNELTLVSEVFTKEKRKHGIFQCSCGKEKQIRVSEVVSGKKQHCGCKDKKRREPIMLIGDKINRLTLISEIYVKNNRSHGLFKCDCGNEKEIAASSVKNGTTKSCGCLQKELCEAITTDISIGDKINFLTLIGEPYRDNGKTMGLFRCDCGTEKAININSVKGERTKSCGCYSRAAASERMTVYNTKYEADSTHPIYQLYLKMLKECDKNIDGYNGSVCCQEWLSYDIFYNWSIENGWNSYHSLVRKDGLIFEPNNCQWIPTGQARPSNPNPEKMRKTMEEKYGGWYTTTDEYKQRAKNTHLTKYGVENANQLDEVKEKVRNSKIKSGKLKTYGGKLVSEICRELGMKHATVTERLSRMSYDELMQLGKSKTGIEIEVKNILEELSSEFTEQGKIGLYKPDFILEKEKIVIECDGLYWHSDAVNKDRNYHQNKRRFYIENGYAPMFFREDQINNKRDIVKSIISNKLRLNNKVYARKCEIRKIDSKTAYSFFDENHLMGGGKGDTIGLFYHDEIVAAIRYTEKELYSIDRFCCKKNISVVGGFSKLIKYLPNNKGVSTFIDRCYGMGDYLEDLGFKLKSEYVSFRWIKGKDSYHRMKYFGNSGYDNGCYKLWDCGQALYVKEN